MPLLFSERLKLDAEVITVLGRRGSGKSTLAKRVHSRYPRKVIFDLMFEYGASEGHVVRSFEEFGRKLVEVNNSPRFTIIVHFNPESKSAHLVFDHCLRMIYHARNIHVVIEEISYYASPHKMGHWLEQLLLRGRHHNISLLCITQRPGHCNKTIISQSGHIYFGQLHDANDLDYCRSTLGNQAFELPNLKPRKFLYFSPGNPIIKIDNDKV